MSSLRLYFIGYIIKVIKGKTSTSVRGGITVATVGSSSVLVSGIHWRKGLPEDPNLQICRALPSPG